MNKTPKVGDTVKVSWYDDPTTYTGEVLEDSKGELFIRIRMLNYDYDTSAYLTDAHEVEVVEVAE
ncbi:unnamed protein product [marine sediment metagenome]|uniref:Hypervirulence associated protein TUDOR domain-containing protein n=1 Tax=marine sediment metagenome TaxID=412755 RepID=X0UE37_9ZZZZ